MNIHPAAVRGERTERRGWKEEKGRDQGGERGVEERSGGNEKGESRGGGIRRGRDDSHICQLN